MSISEHTYCPIMNTHPCPEASWRFGTLFAFLFTLFFDKHEKEYFTRSLDAISVRRFCTERYIDKRT